jgi:signal transduction histidine kinase
MDAVVNVTNVLSVAAALAAGVFLFGGSKRIQRSGPRWLLAGILLLVLFHGVSNTLEWSGTTEALDVFEDYVEILEPALWVFFFYALFQERARRELRESKDRLEDAIAAKADFVSMVSHELRTPLTVILGYSETLLKNADRYSIRPVAERPVGAILRRARHLRTLIEDLIQLSAVDRGTLKVDTERVSVRKELLETVSEFREMSLGKPVSVEWDGEDFDVLCDRMRFLQVIQNLLDNAAKYSEDRVDVLVTTRRQGDRGLIAIRDKGVGIAPEHLDQVFDRFYQGEHVRTRSHGGAGLGLAIAREILSVMDGTITVESEPGKGSTFTVSLPLAPPATPLPA